MSTSVPTVPSVRFERLGSSRDVRRVLRNGTRRSGRQMAVHLIVASSASSSEPAPVRLAVVASRRIGNAVARNRAKRLLREASRRAELPTGSDVVLVARPGIADADLWRVLDEMTDLVAGLTA